MKYICTGCTTVWDERDGRTACPVCQCTHKKMYDWTYEIQVYDLKQPMTCTPDDLYNGDEEAGVQWATCPNWKIHDKEGEITLPIYTGIEAYICIAAAKTNTPVDIWIGVDVGDDVAVWTSDTLVLFWAGEDPYV